ncbi:hypothetical protein QR685DRAFT_444545 [Neurospora intermedia]|uniref:Secreted protein n=1 Tax=Neurospora intermedia TaxID=5142 RepID=A0ABR3DA64_NEUIN
MSSKCKTKLRKLLSITALFRVSVSIFDRQFIDEWRTPSPCLASVIPDRSCGETPVRPSWGLVAVQDLKRPTDHTIVSHDTLIRRRARPLQTFSPCKTTQRSRREELN